MMVVFLASYDILKMKMNDPMERFGTYLFRKGYIKEDEIDVIRYAIEMIISEYLITAIVYIILL